MLLICPFAIHGAWSGKSLPSKDEDEQTMARGELLLAEKSRQMIHGAFDLTAKYILANCFRVNICNYIHNSVFLCKSQVLFCLTIGSYGYGSGYNPFTPFDDVEDICSKINI